MSGAGVYAKALASLLKRQLELHHVFTLVGHKVVEETMVVNGARIEALQDREAKRLLTDEEKEELDDLRDNTPQQPWFSSCLPCMLFLVCLLSSNCLASALFAHAITHPPWYA